MSMEVPTADEFMALAARVTELEQRLAATRRQSESPYMTIPEAAEYLRCNRQRVDDLLSQRSLERVKDGARTLIRRSDLLAYLDDGGTHRRTVRSRPREGVRHERDQ